MTQTRSNAQDTYAKGFGDAFQLGKQALDAIIGNVEVATRGYGELSASWLDFAKTQVEEGAVVAQALGKCKDPKEAVELQSRYAQGAYEKYVAKVAEAQEISLKTANRMTSPFGSGLGAAFGKAPSNKSAA